MLYDSNLLVSLKGLLHILYVEHFQIVLKLLLIFIKIPIFFNYIMRSKLKIEEVVVVLLFACWKYSIYT